jgi:uncharacterized membrane protein YbaN (DUF454 family)
MGTERKPKEQKEKAEPVRETGWRRIRRIIFVVLGFIFFGLGATGAVLPVLPTTPFLILAAACFSRGSARFDAWFKSTKLYQRYLDSFVRNRSMTLRTKIALCGFASAMLILAFIFTPILLVRILIVAVILCKYYYFIFRIKTIKEGEGEGREAAVSPASQGVREAQKSCVSHVSSENVEVQASQTGQLE